VQATGLSKGQLVGVIVASILGLIFLFVLALFLYLWCKGIRNRGRFAALEEDYYIIPPGGRLPGEGSPRHSGEEADPFLQRSSSGWAAATAARAATMSQAPGYSASRPPVGRVPPPNNHNGSGSSGDSNSNASGFGELLDRPSLGMLPTLPEHTQVGGTALSDADMERIAHENVLPDEDQYNDPEYVGAYAYFADPLVPPRLITGDRQSPAFPNPRSPFVPQPSRLSRKGSLSEESVTLLTARRVKVEDLGPRSGPHSPESSSGPHRRGSNGLLGGLNLASLANIGRMSWFKNTRQPIAEPEYSAAPLSEKDIETGRSKVSSERAVDSFGNKTRGVGAGPDGNRPMSNDSARSGTSGGTIYHDAHSSLPGTPLLAPLPPALTSAEQPLLPVTEQSWLSSPLSSPPNYNDRPLASSTPDPTRSPGPASASFDDTPGADILDLPAPTALNRFASISSLKETATGSSLGYKAPPFPPPGLETIRPVGWSDASTDMTASIRSVPILSGLNDHADFGLDVLEEAPPDAEQGWRTMSSGGGSGFVDPGRRGTFGLVSIAFYDLDGMGLNTKIAHSLVLSF